MELKENKLLRTVTLEEKPQDSLLKHIKNKNYTQLEKLLSQGKVDINYEYGHPFNKKALHIACFEFGQKTDSKCVEMLLRAGANALEFARDTQRNALHFAAEGGNVQIVRTIIENLTKENADLTDSTVLLNLVEYIFDADLDEGNYIEILSELLKTNINVNIPDVESGWTVAYMAAKYKFQKIIYTLIKTKGTAINLDNFKDQKEKTARDLIIANNLYPETLPEYCDENSNITIHTLYKNLREHCSVDFLNNYDVIHNTITDKERSNLLCMAIDNNMKDIVDFLVASDANVNEINDLFGYNPLELACRRGDCGVVKTLILKASEETVNQALIDLAKGTYSDREQKIYDDIFKEILNSNKLRINYQDKNKSTCLHYSARYKPSHITLEILKKGASLASKDSWNKLPIADITADTLKNHLDQCIYYTNPECITSDKDACLTVDLRSLLPARHNTVQLNTEDAKSTANQEDSTGSLLPSPTDNYKVMIENQVAPVPATGSDLCTETEVLEYMCTSTELKQLLKHPVILTFIYLKWHLVRSFFYINFFIYNLFLFALLAYISTGYEAKQYPDIVRFSSFSYGLLIITFAILVIREVSQFVIVGPKYFLSFENWLEIILLNVTAIILIEQLDKGTRPFVAIAIVTSAIEFLLLIGHFPSMSTHIMMLRTVSFTFFKLLLWYSILLIAFAYSFYMLFQEDEDEKEENSSKVNTNDEEQDFFLNPGMSLLKTIIMLTGEFDASSIKFNAYPIISQIIFALFVFLITIVLFNLLNGLAVNDTQTIKSDAELYGQMVRVEHISHIERVLLKYNIVKWLPSVQRVCMFPMNTNETKIFIYPNQDCKVILREDDEDTTQLCWHSCTEIHLDRKMERAIRALLDEVKYSNEEKHKNSGILEQISSLQEQMERLQKLLEEKKISTISS